MTQGTIKYEANGTPHYFIGGREISERSWNLIFPSRLAEMLDEQCPPQAVTDTTFMKGTENGRQFQGQEHLGRAYAKVARKHGQNPKGKKYLSGLANFFGDPEAWVESRGDIRRVLEKRGWASEGIVNVKGREAEPMPDVDVAADILEREVKREIKGPVSRKERADIREKVKKRLKGRR